MIKKEVFTGLAVGLIVNLIGVFLCVLIVSQIKGMGLVETFNFYLNSSNLWMLITLGALPNLLAFFGFLKINKEYRARGVLMATFVTAITAYLIYFT